ncbi:GCN5 family acetyltransferase [Paramagnetospirillum marisnigri]|uniref:GCN5 family acetyltransferase n=1 Tax=Paramagnetospirillum marisnigri TaxID=1285242 RepID=A0A178MMG4_9PROT|nr:GNAT family N-acetyltransferase [Paramagnetospirillum marisnigri]OAN49856.1 GCN5 family acetyltransferase [Paramagnetospirillum marisnigri]
MANPHGKNSEKKCTVRLAKAADIAQVIAIDAENTGLFKDEYWQDLFERYNNRTAAPDDDAPLKSANRYRFFLVACDGDSVLGFIIGEVRAWEFGSPPCGWVFAIGVRNQIRQEGVGNTLFEALCDRFRKAGVYKVRTMLARDHTVIMSFFRSHGMMAGPFIELEKDL